MTRRNRLLAIIAATAAICLIPQVLPRGLGFAATLLALFIGIIHDSEILAWLDRGRDDEDGPLSGRGGRG